MVDGVDGHVGRVVQCCVGMEKKQAKEAAPIQWKHMVGLIVLEVKPS